MRPKATTFLVSMILKALEVLKRIKVLQILIFLELLSSVKPPQPIANQMQESDHNAITLSSDDEDEVDDGSYYSEDTENEIASDIEEEEGSGLDIQDSDNNENLVEDSENEIDDEKMSILRKTRKDVKLRNQARLKSSAFIRKLALKKLKFARM